MSDAFLQLSPLHRLVLAYAKAADRSRYTLIFLLDSRLAEVIRSTSETLIGQMRLTWWRDILTKPIADRPAGEPLVALINAVEQHGDDLEPLLDLVEGWAMLLDDFPWDDRQFDQYATKRGESVFRFVLGADRELTEDQRMAAQAWALWDFARHCTDKQMREEAFSRCNRLFNAVSSVRFDRSGRPLSIFCNLAQRDVKTGRLTADLYRPKVASMIIWHGVTGC